MAGDDRAAGTDPDRAGQHTRDPGPRRRAGRRVRCRVFGPWRDHSAHPPGGSSRFSEHVELHRRQCGQVIGPLLAGVLISLDEGFAYAYGLDAVLFTAALYSAIRLAPLPPDGSLRRPGFSSVIDGLVFIGSRPVLLMSFLVDIVAMVLAMPRALYPEVADERFHGSVGPLYAALAIGSVLAGISGGWIARVRRRGVALTG